MKSDKTKGRYAARGVSAGKEEVHAAVDKLDQGVFRGAFCKITVSMSSIFRIGGAGAEVRLVVI